MSGSPLNNYQVRADPDTGLMMIVQGDTKANYKVVGPAVRAALLVDRFGNQARMEPTLDALRVVEVGQVPQYGVDAAANADDSYYDLFVALRHCSHASLYVETQDAVVSFDGGTTDHLFIDVDAGLILVSGLDIPAGATISGKNAVAAADYTNLRISVW